MIHALVGGIALISGSFSIFLRKWYDHWQEEVQPEGYIKGFNTSKSTVFDPHV